MYFSAIQNSTTVLYTYLSVYCYNTGMIIPGYFSTFEVCEKFGWQYQQVAATAKREGWRSVKIGQRGNLYAAEDVELYAKCRLRAVLARKLGRRRFIPIRDASLDVVCPVCGGFAVSLSGRIACENGHETESGSMSVS